MDFTKLFENLAKYLDFIIDVILLHPLDQYTRRGTVDPGLVSYFVAGVLLAYVIASVKSIPGYDSRIQDGDQVPQDGVDKSPAPAGGKANPLSKENPEILAFVVLSILGALVFHFALLLYHKLNPSSSIGNVKDTLNAVFAIGAVYNPLNALLKQVQRIAKMMAPISPGCALTAAGIQFMAALIYFGIIYYYLHAFAAVHGTSNWYISPPLILFASLGLVLGILLIFQARSTKESPAVAEVVVPTAVGITGAEEKVGP